MCLNKKVEFSGKKWVSNQYKDLKNKNIKNTMGPIINNDVPLVGSFLSRF